MVENIDHYQERGQTILPWLYTIARNIVIDYYRREAKTRSDLPLKENLVASAGNPEKSVSQQWEAECVRKALQHLTEVQRQVIIAKFIEERSNLEVARSIGRTEGSIKSLQHRALDALRRAIEKEKCHEP
jgi:RNA polymerase sigma-70 factor (ECF subfamily)